MASLPKELRKQLESAVRKARRASEAGATKALEGLAVAHHEPWPSMSKPERDLRNRLRAHGRQLGDKPDEKRGTQSVNRLATEVGYEQWHRMLFARFLAECELLIEPDSGQAASIDEVRELARERNEDWIELASGWAQRMLPQIFRSGDPVLEVTLPPEARQELESLLEALPREVFVADDSLGWCYQFWQADRKDEVNASGVKIGADELPAVTQLFTEDYMVDFLLDNTLGAWWAGKKLAENPKLPSEAESEEELRKAVALPGTPWSYLRFVKGEDARWTPAAGTFDEWPNTARAITCLDPCMGSGHFIVAMFQRMVALRMAEEGLDEKTAIAAVIAENIFGLEIDPRCTQIAAFNMALTAWRRVGHRPLPLMNLSCSGLGINAREEDWIALAGDDSKAREAMKQLHGIFSTAPMLGSLIDPRRVEGDLFTASFDHVRPTLDRVLEEETGNRDLGELAVAARGIVTAATILAQQFVIVATNVPFLGRGKQTERLRDYCDTFHPMAKTDLSSCLIERSFAACTRSGTVALVVPQNWMFQISYTRLRRHLLSKASWHAVVRLGPKAFSTPMWDFGVSLFIASAMEPGGRETLLAADVSERITPNEKSAALMRASVRLARQTDELKNPDARITLSIPSVVSPLSESASAYAGILNGDSNRFIVVFWEMPEVDRRWRPLQGTVPRTTIYGGREQLILWENGKGSLRRLAEELKERLHNADTRGNRAWGKRGVAISQMGALCATLYTGELFDSNASVVALSEPHDDVDVAALWCYCSSPEFSSEVRRLDQKLNVMNATLAKVPYDRLRWRTEAAKQFPQGLPNPAVTDATQWLFQGHPRSADQPLEVAVARLLGYRWPRQTGLSFPNYPALDKDGLENHADHDGIICLAAVKGESNGADRLLALLADSYGSEWSPAKLNELLSQVGYAGRSLEEWLRDGFFEQHCELFHQRPFVWQIWDGVRNGFSALVNYHKLAAPNGEGRKTLEKLIYSYLGDWIERQRKDQKSGVEGADLRLAAAEHFKGELERILLGEPPYDIFVRWKPLHEQAIGWDPDINDGVRINIRPFMAARYHNARGAKACILRSTPNNKWTKDRGKEPNRSKDDFPWFWGWDENTPDFAGGRTFDGNRWNDLHYTRAFKEAARQRHAAEKRGKK